MIIWNQVLWTCNRGKRQFNIVEKRKIYVTRASLPPFEEFEELIRDIWETHNLTNMGKYHERLKEELKAYLGVSGLELFTNGHLSLEMVLQAFELSGEVITAPWMRTG